MLIKRIKTKEGELLTDDNIKKVINLLEQNITKKAACEILNISYNTTRLTTIITNYKQKCEFEAAQRAKNRGKPPTDYERKTVIEEYLTGEAITNIAKRLFRGPEFVKNILIDCKVPIREVGANFWDNVPLIPEEATRSEFKIKEKVYSVRYQSLAEIDRVFTDKKGQTAYGIFLLAEHLREFAYQPSWELASLEHLKQYGVNL